LLEQYERTSFTDVHADWLHLLPITGDVLDVGAGSGRDSAYMAAHNLHVIAVEPASNFRELGASMHPHPNITWLDDTLPNLSKTLLLNKRFDLILLSAVWMHLTALERKAAIHILCSLLKPSASMIITLRHGESGDDRVMHPVSHEEITLLLSDTKFKSRLLSNDNNVDVLGRKQVSWQTVQITLADYEQ
jgi:2-polyprenyl-3-methyl-5-hydroxy-6-metoxy-1,4-benzoquinol methylase